MKKKFISIVLNTLLFLALSCISVHASQISEEDIQISDYVWLQADGCAYVCDENGDRVTESSTPMIGGEKYYVDANGYLQSGWLYLGAWKMYFDPASYTAKVGFAEIGDKMYLFNDDGVMQTYAGTTIINGKKYWFSDDDASLKTGWLDLGFWKLYFDPETYAARTGMTVIDGETYIFSEDGAMQGYAGTPVINGEKYWVSEEGYLKTGWLYLGDWKMYFDPVTFTAKTGLAEIDGKMYMFNSDGVMQTYAGTTIIDGKKYWFSDDDASLKTGWLNLGSWTLYFDPDTYYSVTGRTEIDGEEYYFDENGVMQPIVDIPFNAYEKVTINWNPEWKYADYSMIHTSDVTLYRSLHEDRPVITINAGHGTKGGGSVKTLCHPDGTPKVTGGSTVKGETRAAAVSSGTTMLDGTAEAKVNLKLALIVRDKLLDAGFSVLMIREDDDVQLDNIARTVFANNNSDCHIAIHYDSSKNDKGFYYMSVPDVSSYKNMEPVASHWQEHHALGDSLLEGIRTVGHKIYSDGKVPIDLTQTSYSTVASVDIEVGDRGSDYSDKIHNKIADGIVAGMKLYFGVDYSE